MPEPHAKDCRVCGHWMGGHDEAGCRTIGCYCNTTTKSRISERIPVHFGEPEYRPACGLPVASTRLTTTDTSAVTCGLCKATHKYKKAVQKMTTPTDPVTHYVAGANSSAACGKGLSTAPIGTRWTNDTGRVNCPSCKASAMFLEALKSRTSGTKAEPDTVPQSEWSKLVGPRSTGVYCVHCQQYHAPREHKLSFDYPPIPYARQAFETRAADLRTEMEQYISGRSNRDELDVAMIRIDQEYLNAMADLHRQGLI